MRVTGSRGPNCASDSALFREAMDNDQQNRECNSGSRQTISGWSDGVSRDLHYLPSLGSCGNNSPINNPLPIISIESLMMRVGEAHHLTLTGLEAVT